MNCTPQSLTNAAACFRCIPKMFRREVMIYLMCQWVNSGLCSNSVVNSWVMRVVANGGSRPSQSTISAMCIFMNTLDAAGITSLIRTMCCFVPDNLIAAITPLVKTYGNDPWTNHGFVTGDLTVNGLKGDAVAKYLDTGFQPATMIGSPNSAGISVSMVEVSGVTQITGECYDSLVDCFTVYWSGIQISVQIWSTPSPVGGATGGPCFASGNRSGTAVSVSWGNTANGWKGVTNTQTQASTIVPVNGTLTVFARNNWSNINSPVIDSFNDQRLSFYAVHDAISAAGQQSLYNAVQALRTSLGGGTV